MCADNVAETFDYKFRRDGVSSTAIQRLWTVGDHRFSLLQV